jgi:phage tail-like protein
MSLNGTPTASRSPAKGSQNPDPVGELRFKVKLQGLPGAEIGRFKECSGIAIEVETKDYSEGGNNEFVHKLPTRIKYPNIVLKRGVTHEDALLKWFLETKKKAVPVEMTISLMGPGSTEVRTWSFVNAYPVKWTGPTLNTGSAQIATETLEIVHQGLKV